MTGGSLQYKAGLLRLLSLLRSLYLVGYSLVVGDRWVLGIRWLVGRGGCWLVTGQGRGVFALRRMNRMALWGREILRHDDRCVCGWWVIATRDVFGCRLPYHYITGGLVAVWVELCAEAFVNVCVCCGMLTDDRMHNTVERTSGTPAGGVGC